MGQCDRMKARPNHMLGPRGRQLDIRQIVFGHRSIPDASS